jgi:D-alanyl-D-alanine carboxypeptidase
MKFPFNPHSNNMKNNSISRYLALIFVCSVTSFHANGQNFSDSMAAFFQKNKNTSSIICIKNDTLVINRNTKKMMPTAGMSNLLVAFEFAKQAAYKVIDSAEMVPLKELARYYLPGNRNDMYSEWLNLMLATKKVTDGRISLAEIARGMLQMGSAALAEYLMDRLGFDNIKSNIQSLGLSGHSSIVPPSASLSLYQNRANTNKKKIEKAIKKMEEEEYCKSAFLMHLAMKNDSAFKSKFGTLNAGKDFIKMWSDRLPQSTTLAYGQLLQMIVKEKTFDKPIFQTLRKIIEWPMQYPTVTNMFQRFSMTGSATPFVFTQAQYGITKNNDAIILVYICENLSDSDYASLARWHQQFELNLFVQPAFLAKTADLLK